MGGLEASLMSEIGDIHYEQMADVDTSRMDAPDHVRGLVSALHGTFLEYVTLYGVNTNIAFTRPGREGIEHPEVVYRNPAHVGYREEVHRATPQSRERYIEEDFVYWSDNDVLNCVVQTVLHRKKGPTEFQARAMTIWPNGAFRWRHWNVPDISEEELIQGSRGVWSEVWEDDSEEKRDDTVFSDIIQAEFGKRREETTSRQDLIVIRDHPLCNLQFVVSPDVADVNKLQLRSALSYQQRLGQFMGIVATHRPIVERYW